MNVASVHEKSICTKGVISLGFGKKGKKQRGERCMRVRSAKSPFESKIVKDVVTFSLRSPKIHYATMDLFDTCQSTHLLADNQPDLSEVVICVN